VIDMVAEAQSALLAFFGVIVLLFILAWPTYRIVSMWLMRDLSGAEAVAALVVLLAFLTGIVTTWGRPLSLLLLLMLATLAGVVWFAGKHHDRRRLNRFFQEDVAASERALVKDPDNAAAHMRLGMLYERRGDLDTAIHHYGETARLAPRDSEGRLALANAIERRRRAAMGSLTCWRCGTENAHTASHCRECGALISDRNQLLDWLTDSSFARAVPWVGLGALVTALLGSLLRPIPVAVTVLAYLLLFAAVLCYVLPHWARARR
jgi:tetratricopeptide (TPR) repeat protein